MGPIPAKEVTFANLNDNIDQRFLEEMCHKYGELVECRICYNPHTRKHLGIGKVVFHSERAARDCCQAYNQKTKMGNVMTVFLDTMGRERAKMIDSLCNHISKQTVVLSSKQMSPVHVKHNSLSQTATSSAVGSSSSPSSSSAYADSTVTTVTTHSEECLKTEAKSPSILVPQQTTSSSLSLESRIKSIFNINILPQLNFSSAIGDDSFAAQKLEEQTKHNELTEIPLPVNTSPPTSQPPPPPPPPPAQNLSKEEKERLEAQKLTFVKQEAFRMLKTELNDIMRRDLVKKLVEQISFKLIDDFETSTVSLPLNNNNDLKLNLQQTAAPVTPNVNPIKRAPVTPPSPEHEHHHNSQHSHNNSNNHSKMSSHNYNDHHYNQRNRYNPQYYRYNTSKPENDSSLDHHDAEHRFNRTKNSRFSATPSSTPSHSITTAAPTQVSSSSSTSKSSSYYDHRHTNNNNNNSSYKYSSSSSHYRRRSRTRSRSRDRYAAKYRARSRDSSNRKSYHYEKR